MTERTTRVVDGVEMLHREGDTGGVCTHPRHDSGPRLDWAVGRPRATWWPVRDSFLITITREPLPGRCHDVVAMGRCEECVALRLLPVPTREEVFVSIREAAAAVGRLP